MAARKQSTRKPRAATKKKRGNGSEEGAEQHEAVSVFELSDESDDDEPAAAEPAPRARRRRSAALDQTDDGAQSAIDDIADSEGRALEGDGDAELDEEMDAASSAAMQALKIIDRDTLLAQLGVEARDDEEDAADDADDEETLDEGDLDVSEPIRKAARRLGIPRLYPEQERVIAERPGRPRRAGRPADRLRQVGLLPDPVDDAAEAGGARARRSSRCSQDQHEKLQQLDVPCVRLDGTVRGKARARRCERIAERRLAARHDHARDARLATSCSRRSRKTGIGARRRRRGALHLGVGLTTSGPRTCASASTCARSAAPPIMALTATATEKVREDISRFLGLATRSSSSSSPHRSNLAFEVLECGGDARSRALAPLRAPAAPARHHLLHDHARGRQRLPGHAPARHPGAPLPRQDDGRGAQHEQETVHEVAAAAP